MGRGGMMGAPRCCSRASLRSSMSSWVAAAYCMLPHGARRCCLYPVPVANYPVRPPFKKSIVGLSSLRVIHLV